MPDEQAPSPESRDPSTPWQPPGGLTGPVPDAAGEPQLAYEPTPSYQPPQSYQPPSASQPAQVSEPAPTYNWPSHASTPWASPSPAMWSQTPPPPPQRPSRVRALVAGSVVALATALIAGAIGYEIGTHHSRISAAVQSLKAAAGGACPAGKTTPDPSATSPAGAPLLARLLPIPPGDKTLNSEKQGVLSLDDYLSELYTGDSAEMQRLTAVCFQTAVNRTWEAPGGAITSVWLIQLGSSADARSYTLSTEQADAADPANTDKFTVNHVSDGLGLGRPALDTYGNTLTRVLGDAGDTSIIIHVFVPARTDNAIAAAVLQQQFAQLNSGHA